MRKSRRALIDAAVDIARDARRATTWSFATARRFVQIGRRRTSTSRFARSLEPDVDANMLAIPRKQRAMVRKGIKHGLVGVIDDGTDRFFDLYADNVHRHGTPALAAPLLRASEGNVRQRLRVTDRADGRTARP